ncbi:zinc-binding dehydrogenase [Chryseoglobus sp. 28M-23]|nr:zinc-binding dehydrogenase [Chryseoglobus sp. 28M-23]
MATGAHVTGVVSAAKSAFVRDLGAERTIDYRVTPDPAQWGPHDVVIDTADGRPLAVLRRALTPRGTLVIVGADGVGGGRFSAASSGRCSRRCRAPGCRTGSRARCSARTGQTSACCSTTSRAVACARP